MFRVLGRSASERTNMGPVSICLGCSIIIQAVLLNGLPKSSKVY